jgi:hypothetical protein
MHSSAEEHTATRARSEVTIMTAATVRRRRILDGLINEYAQLT